MTLYSDIRTEMIVNSYVGCILCYDSLSTICASLLAPQAYHFFYKHTGIRRWLNFIEHFRALSGLSTTPATTYSRAIMTLGAKQEEFSNFVTL